MIMLPTSPWWGGRREAAGAGLSTVHSTHPGADAPTLPIEGRVEKCRAMPDLLLELRFQELPARPRSRSAIGARKRNQANGMRAERH